LTYDILGLIFFLVIIVVAAEVFTNAVETLGSRLNFSEGVTGSIFAAVGTAMPETMVPLVAIFTGDTKSISEEVGVGAILGAPFMLSTLAMLLIGIGAWHFRRRRRGTRIRPEPTGFRRDIEFFLFTFTLAFLVAFTPAEYRGVRLFVAFVLVLTYFYYILETVKASAELVRNGHGTEESKPLYLSLILKEHLLTVLLQLLVAVAVIIIGAKGFVGRVEHLADLVGLPVIARSLLIVPVATELPEKMNSILWIRKGSDTLAVGNLTGAMVFQGSILPAIGIFLTPWAVNLTVVSSGIITIAASLWLYLFALRSRPLGPGVLLLNGALYVLFIVLALGGLGLF